jgi:hypothetical protein
MRKTEKQIDPEWMGVDQAEALTGISRWSWRRAAYSGSVESTKWGRRLLIPTREIRRVLAENTRPRVQKTA